MESILTESEKRKLKALAAKKPKIKKLLEGKSEAYQKKFLQKLVKQKKQHEYRKSLAQNDAPTQDQTEELRKAAQQAELQNQMMKQAMRMVYDGPIDAVMGSFTESFEIALLFVDVKMIGSVLIGGVICACFTEYFAHRFP